MFLFVINHGANFSAELFSHALDYRILLGAAATADCRAVRSNGCAIAFYSIAVVAVLSDGCAGNDLQLHGAAQNPAGRGDGQASRFGTDRHVDNGLRFGDLDDQLVGLHAPLASFEHGDQDALVAVGERLQDGGLQAVDL